MNLKSALSFRKIIFVLAIFILAGAGILFWYISSLSRNLVETTAIQSGESVSKMLAEFRTLYTSEVVERVRPAGIEVTHDYLNKPQAIPLPATFSMELGTRIAVTEHGLKTRLYSDYPFPWRKAESAQDDFEKKALAYLNGNPDRPFYRIEDFKGERSLRYATADRMRASCVACHNTHPDSPKKDWKVGDVRGALEVVIPLETASAQSKESLKGTLFVVSSLAVLTLAGFIVVIVTLRQYSSNERKLLEQRMLQSEKMAAVGQLAGGIAHEINNPLGIILGFAQNVAKRIPANDPLEMPVKSIEREALRCKNLVQELLTFSRVGKTEQESLDIKETIESVLSLVQTQANVKNVTLVKDLSEVPHVPANRIQIQQIVVNLCNNAVDAMPKGGMLTVSLHKVQRDQREGVEMQVRDTGQGIPEEIRDKIFTPFFTTKAIGQGTGLGLSLVYEIVQKHDGRITIDSKIGSGTAVKVFFPRTR